MNRHLRFTLVLASTLLLAAQADTACAQDYTAGASVYRSTQNYLYNRPTVSPYLNLTTRDANQGLPQYFTSVRPRLEQRQRQVAQQRQNSQLQRQLNQVTARQAQMAQQQQGMILTGQMGWSRQGNPRFGIYLNHYPGMRVIGRQ